MENFCIACYSESTFGCIGNLGLFMFVRLALTLIVDSEFWFVLTIV